MSPERDQQLRERAGPIAPVPGPVLDSPQERQSETGGLEVLSHEQVPISKMGILPEQTLYGQLTVFRIGNTLAACVEAIDPTLPVTSAERWGWKSKGVSRRCQILRLYVTDSAREKAVVAAMIAADRRPVFPARGTRFNRILKDAVRRVAGPGGSTATGRGISDRPGGSAPTGGSQEEDRPSGAAGCGTPARSC